MSSSSTPIYHFPYPNGDDALSNLANRIEELAYYLEYSFETLGINLAPGASLLQAGDAAGGVLSGSYPNPSFAVDMATQTELDAHVNASTSVHGISDTNDLVYTSDSRLSDERVPTDGSVTNAKVASGAAIAYSKLDLAGSVQESDLDFSVATQAEIDAVAGDLGTHEADTTSVHGISNTGDLVYTSDARLSNARTPTSHAATHASAGSDPVTIAPSQVTGTAVITTDSRLSDARTPTTHASSHGSAGSDPITIANTQVTGLGTASTKNAPATGNAASGETVLGSDTRLTDARTPTTHASSHIPGGSDEIDLTKIVALSGSFPTFPNSLYPAGALLAYGASAPYTLYRSTGSAWEQVGSSAGGSTPTGPAGGDLTGTYPNPTLAAAGTSGTYTKVSTDSKGRVTSGTTLSATDIPTLTLSKISDAGTAAAKNVPSTGDAASGEVVLGSDSRLTDSRAPSGSAGGDLTGTYPNPTLGAVGTSGTYTKVTTDSKGRVSSGTTLSKTDIPTIDANQVTGTAVTTADTGTVTNTMLAGSITDTKLSTISTAGKISNSATTATSANTASAIVARDASGNFSAGTITASLSGNASTVTNGVYTTDSGTVTNTMLAGSIADSKLSTISTAGKVSNSATTAASANTASAIVARDASGNFSANTITASLSGNASTVTNGVYTTDTGTVTSTMIANDTIVNADVNSAAAIAYSKLNLNNSVVQGDLVAALQALLVPTGTVTPYAGTSAPTGWLLCDGSNVAYSTYTDLFNTFGLRTTTATTTNASTTVSGLSGVTSAMVGWGISGTNIPSAATIATVVSSSSVTISAAATGTATGTATILISPYKFTGAGNTTNFLLPDLTGRAVFGKEAAATRITNVGSGITGSQLGDTGGNQLIPAHSHSFTNAFTLPNHVHSDTFAVGAHTHSTDIWDYTSQGLQLAGGSTYVRLTWATQAKTSSSTTPTLSGSVGNPTTNPTIGGTGTVGAVNAPASQFVGGTSAGSANMPPAIIMNYIIKT